MEGRLQPAGHQDQVGSHPLSTPLPSTLWLSIGLPWPEPHAGDTEEADLDSDLELGRLLFYKERDPGRWVLEQRGAEKVRGICCGR